MSYPLPNFLSTFTAKTSLETPQINLAWAWDTAETVDLERFRIRRSTTRHPVDETEGTLVQEWTANTPVGLSESAGLTADEFYYYAAFGRYLLPIRSSTVFDHDIRRVFTDILGVYDSGTADHFWVVGRSSDGYSRVTLDGERGFVTASETLEGIDPGVKACIGAGTFAGETTTFFCDNQAIYGVTSAGKATQVDFQWYGGEVVGGYVTLVAGAVTGFGLLDVTANQFIVFDSVGAVVSTTDYSPFGSGWTGCVTDSTTVYHLLSSPGVTGVEGPRVKIIDTSIPAQVAVVYSDIPPTTGIGFVNYGGFGIVVVSDPSESGRFKGFDPSVVTHTFLTEAPDVDVSTVLMHHATFGSPPGVLVDSGPGGFDATLLGAAIVVPTGKFLGCLDLTGAPGSCARLPAALGAMAFLPGTGTESFWFKADPAFWADPNPYYLWYAGNSLGPEVISLVKVPGVGLVFTVDDGILAPTAVVPLPTDGDWHHALMVRDIVGGTISLRLDDGAPVVTVSPVAIVALLNTFRWGGDAVFGNTFPGFLDEFRAVVDARPSLYTDEYAFIQAGTSEAFAGGERIAGICARDVFAKEGFIPGEILETDATNKISASDLVTSTFEILRRGWPTEPIGHTARLHRLLGLFFDQLADLRRYWFPPDVDKCGEDILALLMQFTANVRPNDVLNPRTLQQYPIDWVRQYLRLLNWIAPRVGLSEALEAVVHYYSLRTIYSLTQPRRHFDSGIPFDSGMVLDSWSSIVAAIQLNAAFWDDTEVITNATDGVTSIPVVKQLTTVAGSFTNVRSGDMVRLMDSSDLGDYVVDAVLGPLTLTVTTEWPAGGQAGVSFRVIERIPNEDPISEYVRGQMQSFSAAFVDVLGDA